MRNLVRVLLCASLCVFAVARAIPPSKGAGPAVKKAQKKETGQKADAKTLLNDAKKALTAIIKNAREDKSLDPKEAKNKPFWRSIHLVVESLKTAESGLAAKSNDFFKGIADARKAEEQMKVDWRLTDSNNKEIIEDGKKLGHALALLRTDFSKEAERQKKGGELTAQEKAQFEKIKAQQKELLVKIKKLEVEAKKDKALEKGLAELKKQAEHVVKEPATLDAYISTLYLLDVQAGLIRGYEYYVDKRWRNDYIVLVDYTKTYDTWYSGWETSVSYDWAEVDTAVDIYEGEDVDVTESVSEEETKSEESYAENESFDMSEAEEDEVAADEENNEEVESDDEEDSMDDASDDEGEDMGDDQDSGDDDSDDGGGDDGD